jgi:hypothetical protein
MLAAERGHVELVKYLIEEAKADANQLNAIDDATLLMYACKSGNSETVSYVFGLFRTKEDVKKNLKLENKVSLRHY